jgi:hypothetical protein
LTEAAAAGIMGPPRTASREEKITMPQKKNSPSAGDIIGACLLFERPGPQNTERTLEWAARRAKELGAGRVLVATRSGETALKALSFFEPGQVVAVTHSAGYSKPNAQELPEETRRRLEAAGVRVLTCQHAFGGVGRAVRKKLGTYEVDEIMAFTLRIFGQGTKVAIEISLMAADAGLVPAGEICVAVGGTERGADTALLLRPSNSQTFFDLKVVEVLAKPR